MFKNFTAEIKQQWRYRFPFDKIFEVLQDLQATQRLTALIPTYLPWSGFALRPSGIERVLNEILFNRSRCIVECGGGMSTIYIAALLRQVGKGHLITVEHDLEWLELVQEWLQSQGLQDYVTLVGAPLVESPLALKQNLWYDATVVREALNAYAQANAAQLGDNKPFQIDLLLVDGPPAYQAGKELARYPAVPFFQEFFAKQVVVVLDDFQRAGEQEILKRWEATLKIPFVGYRIDGGVAIAKTESSFDNTTEFTLQGKSAKSSAQT